ncbi:XRE family transcriptional regulator [Sphaerisporangium album]|uniref:XRE family transcriptional regulator n=1 Tax=Sphaerisporangium album TaxID=509200 RepID=A0A367FTL8_9ACTN|nr:helix-turn-helix transcriptional regulator [Sphaerisporangium album]RCG33142.1 XRE family transcriptional regulator [Sphaerisporangium album]
MVEQPNRFGEELRRRRLAAGLTLTQLAGLVHYSKGQLSKVERGLKPPSRELATHCDAKLDAKGALTALARASLPGTEAEAAETSTGDEEVWLMQLSPDGQSWFRTVGRRQVVVAGAASMAAMSIGRPGASSTADGERFLEASRSLFDEYRRLGQTGSPGFLMPALIAQTHVLRELSAHAGSRVRRDLLKMGSRYAEYVGWLAQEAGDERAALWWTRRAVELAAAGGDGDLAAYGLVRRALVTLYRGEAEQTVELARRAQSGTVPPRIHGLAAQREAQGHALAGDYDASMRGLDRARTLLARHTPDAGSPVIGSTNLPDSVAMVTGWCLHDLGRCREAAEILDAQLAQVPSHATRTQVRYGVRRALAYAAAGEIDHACELAERLLGDAIIVSSATVGADLRSLARTLARHPRNPAVRSLAPRLATALHVIAP